MSDKPRPEGLYKKGEKKDIKSPTEKKPKKNPLQWITKKQKKVKTF